MEQDEQTGMHERLRAWRHAHPQATFDEIEEAVQQEVVRLQAQLVEGLVAESASAAPGAAPGAAPTCPSCAAPMRRCGSRTRQVVSRLGHPVRVKRDYYVCPACGVGLFPPR